MASLSNAGLLALRKIHEREMRFKCYISQEISPGENRRGEPLPGVWTPIPGSPVKCLYKPAVRESTGREQNEDVEYVKGRYQLEVPIGTNISTSYRIDLVEDQLGVNQAPDVNHFEIKDVGVHPTCEMMVLEAIR
jgi:hypothetical protein